MARTVFHVGPLGAGVSAKIISNFLGMSNVALVREALRMAAGAGIGEKEILRIIQDGGVGSSWVSNNWQLIRTQEENYTTGKGGHGRDVVERSQARPGPAGAGHDRDVPG